MPVDVRRELSKPLPRTERQPVNGSGGFVVVHPRREAEFRAAGLCTAEDFLNLPGEVVSGHPDRHVVQVKVPIEGVAYLKRQHYVRRFERIRNAIAGFGFISKSLREALVLRRLEEARIDAPGWLAYGEAPDGRAFLLVADIAPYVELRTFLARPEVSRSDRRLCAGRVGQYLAELHAAGIHHPDTTAKHCYIDPATLSIAFIDWQSATLQKHVPPRDAARSFAAFHASIPEGLVGDRERLRVLGRYRSMLRTLASSESVPEVSSFISQVKHLARRQWNRRSIREQRLPRAAADQRLVWLAGESVCVVPAAVPWWPQPADGLPFYVPEQPIDTRVVQAAYLPDGRHARLIRRRELAPLSRRIASIRGRAWRSPELRLARVLFHLERHDVPAARLLAFGQKLLTRSEASSFLLHDLPAKGVPLIDWLASTEDAEERTRILEITGLLLRQLHSVGCRFDGSIENEDVIHVTTGQPLTPVVFTAVSALRLVRKLSVRHRSRDLKHLLSGPFQLLDENDRAHIRRGYHGEDHDDA